jgi:hypothetical protein
VAPLSPGSTFPQNPFQTFNQFSQQPRFQSRPTPAGSGQTPSSIFQQGLGQNGNFFSVFNPAAFATPASTGARSQRAINSRQASPEGRSSFQRIEYHFPDAEFGGFKPVDHRYPAARSDEDEEYFYYDDEDYEGAIKDELRSAPSERRRNLGDYRDSFAYERVREDPRLEKVARARRLVQSKKKQSHKKQQLHQRQRQQQQVVEREYGGDASEDVLYYDDDEQFY